MSKSVFGKTVQEHIVHYNHNAPGFDALRFCLATLIVLWHSVAVCYPEGSDFFNHSWSHPLIHPFLKAILPMFFFLSGFLVSASAFRTRSTFTFLLYRVFRIFPALLVEVAISAVFLGALMTTLPLGSYYSDSSFLKYFFNILGNVQFYLAGVFENHPCTIVNVNLWTLPAEFYCYAIMAALMLTRVLFNKKLFLGFFLILLGVLVYFLPNRWTWGDLGVVFVRPTLLVFAFLIGVLFFIFADKIPIKRSLFLISIAGLFFFNLKYTNILGVIFSCYLCLCLGFMDFRRFPLVQTGDYSYGIYLYSFPIEQTVWHFVPWAREWWILFLIAYPITLLFSVVSWRLIEQPFLKLKRHFQRS